MNYRPPFWSVQKKIIHFFENILSDVANVCNALFSVKEADLLF
jgi:hypothetical protein